MKSLSHKSQKGCDEPAFVFEFLQRATPFQTLDPEHLKELARRLQRRTVPKGEAIVRQGEVGDRCFFVQEGAVEVIQNDGHQERAVAVLESGALFGETSLLTESPRNATVRAIKPTQLLALSRSDFLEALSWNRLVAPALFELLRLRDRPIRCEEITVQSYTSQDGEKITTLKNLSQGTYYKLSDVGCFVWERLDGHHNLKDLAIEYLKRSGSFAPHTIAEVAGGLVSSGFAKSQTVKARKYLPSLSFGEKVVAKIKGIMEWRAVLRHVDPFFTRLYRVLRLRLLYTKVALSLIALVSLAGLIVFIFRIPALLTISVSIPFVIFSLLFIALSHDLGHAITTKFFGREILGIGIGWNWFSPIVFVDTSDMWPTPPPHRIAVHLAGLYTNLFFAGLASLFVWPFGLEKNLIFSLLSYLVVILNALPFFNSDGQYALSDFLEWKRSRTSSSSR
ncbi:MAG: cyclic nucleotide-binding domain-containing protein [Deltaproteobacteria bacterium]|nr:cyclic nucleotide-binding domain-containing protein [Deltaproteobacteria bacterium]